MANQSAISEFLLKDFSQLKELQILHFLFFLILYLATVTGNLLIICTIRFDHKLHTPMYIFLMNLAIQDLGSVSVIIPKSVANSLMHTRHISYCGCAAQVLLSLFFIFSDFFLLTVMAYDRYVAICSPLQYEMLVNKHTCVQILAGVWSAGLFLAVLHTGITFAIPFCSNVIDQFFCEIPQLLKLSCSNSTAVETGAIVLSVIIESACFIFIIITYVYIFSTVLRMPSAQRRQKAFSTCIPHLTVIAILLFTVWFAYLSPVYNTLPYMDTLFAVIYSVIPPLLNPVIYSLRNQEIQAALSNLLGLKKYPKTPFFGFLL
ncbi:olfactory receptor 14A16-like [Varanus komodoensis]|uniref:Olfactory receptor n=1 Tax=Varanus komodoensis TaxID=61221 RepID=A0A8D2L438_VARKO|nr:olfactory receptor 14A16-like [Varanus komodoensis]